MQSTKAYDRPSPCYFVSRYCTPFSVVFPMAVVHSTHFQRERPPVDPALERTQRDYDRQDDAESHLTNPEWSVVNDHSGISGGQPLPAQPGKEHQRLTDE